MWPCKLEYVAGDHADDSVVIYIPEYKILFLGDATYQCLCSHLPYYSSQGVLELIKKLSKYNIQYALESHTDQPNTKDSFKAYLTLLQV